MLFRSDLRQAFGVVDALQFEEGSRLAFIPDEKEPKLYIEFARNYGERLLGEMKAKGEQTVSSILKRRFSFDIPVVFCRSDEKAKTREAVTVDEQLKRINMPVTVEEN